jgi:hypothetical protein
MSDQSKTVDTELIALLRRQMGDAPLGDVIRQLQRTAVEQDTETGLYLILREGSDVELQNADDSQALIRGERVLLKPRALDRGERAHAGSRPSPPGWVYVSHALLVSVSNGRKSPAVLAVDATRIDAAAAGAVHVIIAIEGSRVVGVDRGDVTEFRLAAGETARITGIGLSLSLRGAPTVSARTIEDARG